MEVFRVCNCLFSVYLDFTKGVILFTFFSSSFLFIFLVAAFDENRIGLSSVDVLHAYTPSTHTEIIFGGFSVLHFLENRLLKNS